MGCVPRPIGLDETSSPQEQKMSKHDTLTELNRKRINVERQLKRDEQRAAEVTLRAYGAEHDWPQEDIELVYLMLGLDREPNMLIDTSDLDPKPGVGRLPSSGEIGWRE
jgi:hypothetical protein